MGIEIEHKFLVASNGWKESADAGVKIEQGYFDTPRGLTVRVRLAGERAFLTLKGAPDGLARSEFEYAIPPSDARAMLREFCGARTVEKIRYRVPYQGHVFEVDVFSGRHAGLVFAEIELSAANEPFARPPWLGRDVSGAPEFTNRALASKNT